MRRWLERTRAVRTPDGARWTVRRILLPRRRVVAGRGKELARTAPDREWAGWRDDTDVALFDGDARALLLIVVGSLILFVVLAPALILILDIIVVVLVAAAGLVGRILFRRPWRVEASSDREDSPAHSWGVVGTRASAEAVDRIAAELTAGNAPGAITVGVALTP